MSEALAIPGRLAIAAVIARREAKAATRGIGGYVALTLALAAATWMLLIDLRAVAEAGVLVSAEPFRAPLAVAMLVVMAFLAISAAISASRDRESGTLEVLFYGPVDELSYVLGKVGGLLAAYVAALPLLLLGLWLLAAMTGFMLTPAIVASLALSVVPAAEIVGFGVLLSVGASRVRTAVLLLIGVIALLLGASLAYSLVLLVPIDDPSSPVIPLRDALAALNGIVVRISPFAHLERIVDGLVSGAWRTAIANLAAAIAYAAATILLAAIWLRRRGVHRRGE